MGVEKTPRGMLMKVLGLAGLHPWLTCRECVESVTEFLEGALSPQGRALVLAHLERCPDCPRYFCQIELTGRLARATTHDPKPDWFPPAARAALLDAFRSAAPGSRRGTLVGGV